MDYFLPKNFGGCHKPEGGVLESVKALGSEYVGLGQKYSTVTNDGGYIVSTPISNKSSIISWNVIFFNEKNLIFPFIWSIF